MMRHLTKAHSPLLALALVLVLLLPGLGCSSSDNAPLSDLSVGDLSMGSKDQQVADLAIADQTMPPDEAPAGDLTVPPDQAHVDAAVGQCRIDGDCRLFSSYCDSAPCQCLPLPAGAQDPPCNGRMVTCLTDPCRNKKPVCDKGQCIAG